MNERDERMRDLLKRAVGPAADPELKRDLWPEMRERIERPAIRVPWWDWALAAAVILCCLLFPGVIPAVLHQL